MENFVLSAQRRIEVSRRGWQGIGQEVSGLKGGRTGIYGMEGPERKLIYDPMVFPARKNELPYLVFYSCRGIQAPLHFKVSQMERALLSGADYNVSGNLLRSRLPRGLPALDASGNILRYMGYILSGCRHINPVSPYVLVDLESVSSRSAQIDPMTNINNDTRLSLASEGFGGTGLLFQSAPVQHARTITIEFPPASLPQPGQRPQLGFFQRHLGFCLSRREFVRQTVQRLKFRLRGPQSPLVLHLLFICRTLSSLRLPRRQRQIPTQYYPEEAPFNAENIGPALSPLSLKSFCQEQLNAALYAVCCS